MMLKVRDIDFDKKQHRDAFSTAFNLEQKYVNNQFKLNAIPVSTLESSKYLPPKIQIDSIFLKQQRSYPYDMRLKQQNQHLCKLENKAKEQISINLNNVYNQLNANRTESPLKVQYSPLKQRQKQLKRYITIPSAIYSVPRLNSSMSVRCYSKNEIRQSGEIQQKRQVSRNGIELSQRQQIL